MLLVKPGFDRLLGSMLDNFAYIGTDFSAFGQLADTLPARTVVYQYAYDEDRLIDACARAQ